ncbi:unnamed protein product [Rotaria socialis]|uniref:Uncharacterized protein n=1 Tax=Rotaria socialis TaxID=392032 RepID=A0A821J6L5_9BILA|nr:unnamed protein product [Rotaria socialis]CAF4713754.1 unnamed protein product [Rotaria socialis]
MLSSFATASTSSSSSPYETSSSRWKFNFTTNSFAALSAIFFASYVPSPQESSIINVAEKRKTSSVYNYRLYTNGNSYHDGNADDEPLRILLFSESFPSFTSGVVRRFKEIVRRLVKRRHHIHIITGCNNAVSWTEGNELLEKYVTFTILPSTEFTNKIDCACPFLFPNVSATPILYSVIRRISPDVIHIIEQTPAALLCGAFAKALEIPIVWSSHTNIDFYLSTYIRPFAVTMTRRIYQFIRLQHLCFSSINLTVSKDFADFMEQTGIPKPVIVWKTGVDSDLFNPSRYSSEMRYRMFGTYNNYTKEQMDTITLFLCVGRISPEKNFEFLSLVLERIPSQTFLCIIGDGPYRQTLEPRFPKDRVHFFGFLGGDELASAYASADYFIYASVSETFGQVYLEAMACGTPVIAAEGGQLKEFFVNGEHGYLWEPDDLDSAEEAVREAMKDRKYLSTKARTQALKHSWEAASDQINSIYHDAIRNHKEQESNKKTSKLKHIWHLAYYFFIWLICNLCALFFMAPFIRVSPPQSVTTKKINKLNGNSVEEQHNSLMTKKSSVS